LDILPRVQTLRFAVDAGCGAGGLVYMLASVGCNSSGFDPDSNYIQWARGLMGEKVIPCQIKDMNVKSGTLDLVTLYHVLEHIRDPQKALFICAEWLREDGLCVVEVPNIESKLQGPGHQYQKGHLHYFNRQALEALASQSCLRAVDGGVFNGGENLRCYFRKDSNLPPLCPSIPDNAKRILSIHEGHTWMTHYTSGTPYIRAWKRFQRTITEMVHSSFRSEMDTLLFHAARLRQLTAMRSKFSLNGEDTD
jgi:SAM-dependent methyltransferase